MAVLDRILVANRAAQHAWQVLWDAMPYRMSTDPEVMAMRDAMGELREAVRADFAAVLEAEPDLACDVKPENALADGAAEGC